jgi:hypothetical protein
MSNSDEDNIPPEDGQKSQSEETDLELSEDGAFSETDANRDNSPAALDETDEDAPVEDDFGDSDFDDDDFVEDDFEDDWVDDPQHDNTDSKGGQKGGGSRSDLTTKLIIGGGVVLGLGIMYFQLFAGGGGGSPRGGGGSPQSGLEGSPPQPTAIQTQTQQSQKVARQQNGQQQGREDNQQGTQTQGGVEKDGQNPQQDTRSGSNQAPRGFMNNPGQLDMAKQDDDSDSAPDAVQGQSRQNTDIQSQGTQQKPGNGAELPTPDANELGSPVATQNQKLQQTGAQLPGMSQKGGPEQQNSPDDKSSPPRSQNGTGSKTDSPAQQQQKDKAQSSTNQQSQAVAETLTRVNERLETVMDRLDGLEKRIEIIDKRVKQDKSQQDNDTASEDQIQALRDQIRQLGSKIKQSRNRQSGRQEQRTQSGDNANKQERKQNVNTPARPPVSAIKRKPQHGLQRQQRIEQGQRQQPRSPGQWILRSAQPGLAYIVRRQGGALKSITTGDRVAGLGRITAIYQQDGRWIVQGTQGTLRQ